MTQNYELIVKGIRNFENKVTVTLALQDKERFDGEIFDLDVAMDRVEGAALEFYEAAARRSVRQVLSATANGDVSRLMKRHRRLVFFPFTIVVTAAAGTGHVRTAVNIFSQPWMP